MKTIGLLGGMSWESTIPYYRLINEGIKAHLGGLHSASLLLHSVDFHEIEACASPQGTGITPARFWRRRQLACSRRARKGLFCVPTRCIKWRRPSKRAVRCRSCTLPMPPGEPLPPKAKSGLPCWERAIPWSRILSWAPAGAVRYRDADSGR